MPLLTVTTFRSQLFVNLHCLAYLSNYSSRPASTTQRLSEGYFLTDHTREPHAT